MLIRWLQSLVMARAPSYISASRLLIMPTEFSRWSWQNCIFDWWLGFADAPAPHKQHRSIITNTQTFSCSHFGYKPNSRIEHKFDCNTRWSRWPRFCIAVIDCVHLRCVFVFKVLHCGHATFSETIQHYFGRVHDEKLSALAQCFFVVFRILLLCNIIW